MALARWSAVFLFFYAVLALVAKLMEVVLSLCEVDWNSLTFCSFLNIWKVLTGRSY